MARILPAAGLAWLACAAAACHLMGGLSDLSYTDAVGGGGSAATTSTSSGGSDAGSTSSGGSGQGGEGGAGGLAPCHPPGVTDGFDGSSLDMSLWDLWADTDVTVGVEGGVVFIQPPPSYAGSRSGEVFTRARYDLTDCSAWIEIVSPLDPAAPGSCFFQIYVDTSNDAEINIEYDQIFFEIEIDDDTSIQDAIAYSPTEHRWLRIRDEDGTLYQETSPDGLNWTVRLSSATPWWIDQVEIGFGAGTWDYTDTPGRFEADNVNVLP